MGYLSLLIKSTFSPATFWAKKVAKIKLSTAWWFLVTTLVLEQLVDIAFRVIDSQKITILFLTVSELVFLIPLTLIGFMAITAVIHLIASAQGGKASFQQTLLAMIFSSGPMILLSIDQLGVIAFIYQLLLMVYALQWVHKFGVIKAIITVAIPALILSVILSSLGLLSI